MRPEFADALRERLMLEAPERLAELAASTASDSGRTLGSTTRRRVRVARIAAVTCLVVGVTGGVAAASQSALPGDPLYGVKRGIERAQVSFAGSDATEGQRLVNQASTRLDEISDLALSRPDDAETTRLIEQTLADFSPRPTTERTRSSRRTRTTPTKAASRPCGTSPTAPRATSTTSRRSSRRRHATICSTQPDCCPDSTATLAMRAPTAVHCLRSLSSDSIRESGRHRQEPARTAAGPIPGNDPGGRSATGQARTSRARPPIPRHRIFRRGSCRHCRR